MSVIEAPVPSEPSISDVQTIPALRSPSSSSADVPINEIVSVTRNVPESAGDVMVTTGVSLTGVIIIVTVAEADICPAASFTVYVKESVVVSVPS